MTEPTASIAGDLLIGAGEIAKFIYGNDGEKAAARRLSQRLRIQPFQAREFSVAALKSTIHAEVLPRCSKPRAQTAPAATEDSSRLLNQSGGARSADEAAA